MQNALVDNTPRAYKCPNETEPDGVKCRGTLVFEVGQLVAQCPDCSAWTGIAAPRLTQLEVQTGAVTGAASKWTMSGGRRFQAPPAFTLECGVDKCHFKRHLETYRVHASAVIAIMNEHPCPQPPAEPVQIEALPVAEEREPEAEQWG